LTTRIRIVLAAIVPEHLKEDEDDLVLSQMLKGRDKRNEHLLVAPIKCVIDPERPRCPIAVVSLHALHDGPGTLARLTSPIARPSLPANGAATVLYLPNGEPHHIGAREEKLR
jgi:hypothetical protein